METIAIGSHTLCPGRELLLDEHRVELGVRALTILSVLAEHLNEVVTKDELLDAVWPDTTVEENALQVHVGALRKALGQDAAYIETVRGIGYALRLDIAEGDSPISPSRTTDNPENAQPQQSLDTSAQKPRSFVWYLAGAALLLVTIAAVIMGTSPTATAQKAISVAPIQSISGAPDETALAAGITNELIVRLRRIDELKVATARGDGTANGRTLRGTLQSDGQMLRLTVLLEARDGTVQWSEAFEREINDLFDIQEEIARAVSGALSVSLDVGIEARSFGGTDNPEAYANYVRGRAHRQSADRTLATSYLERALALDSNYVKAMTELTYANGITLYTAGNPDEAARLKDEMDRLSARALETAPDLWLSHAARGWYYAMRKDFVKADRAHDRVKELDPGNDPEVFHTLANFNLNMGRTKAAARFRAERSLIDPIFSNSASPGDYFANRDFERVIEIYERGEDVFTIGHERANPLLLYWALRLSGQKEKARDLAKKVAGDQPEFRYYITMDYGGQFQDLPYAELKAFASKTFGSGGRDRLSELANHASQQGNHRLALDYLRLAFDERDAIGAYFGLWHPALAPTRQTPEFAEWLVDLGIPDAWRESEDWGDFCRPISDTAISCE